MRGDYVQPWDNIRGHSAVLRPGGMYVVDSAGGIVHSEDAVVLNTYMTVYIYIQHMYLYIYIFIYLFIYLYIYRYICTLR